MIRHVKRRSKAFTLLEIMLVLIIIGVMAGAVTVSFSGHYQDLLLENAAKNLEEMARFARQHARNQHVYCRLNIDRVYGSFNLTESKHPDREFAPIDDTMLGAQQLDNGVRIAEIVFMDEGKTFNNHIEFRPNGEADSTEILLRNARDDVRKVFIYSL